MRRCVGAVWYQRRYEAYGEGNGATEHQHVEDDRADADEDHGPRTRFLGSSPCGAAALATILDPERRF